MNNEDQAQVPYQLRLRVENQVLIQARNRVDDQIWIKLGLLLLGQVTDQVLYQVRLQVRRQVWSRVRVPLTEALERQYEQD